MPTKQLLNDRQLEAITFGKGPLLIIAGAGTGKTTVITERIKHLILKENVLPSQILALTFTEKASREMEERIDIAMPYGYTQLWISTFHAFCDRILRNEAINIGLNPAYKLMTETESLMFLRTHIFDLKLEYFRPLGNPHKFLEGLLQHFSRLKDEDISPEEYLQFAGVRGKRKGESQEDEDEMKKTKELANAYKTYEDLKAKEGVMDFSDMISNTLKLFRQRKNILKHYQEQFKYILVDEFQDTNYAQNMLAILLAGDKQNITVVGDDDQAIYRWRGAAISNMIQFRKHFSKTHIITLTQNYRSTQEILDTSHLLVSNNNPDRLEVKEHIDKKLVANRKGKSYPIEFLYEQRVEDEADASVKKIQELVSKEKYVYKDFAILVRANDHANAFTKALQRNNIPYQFLGPGRLFRQEEIKDLVAYLKILYNFDDSASVYRVLCSPTLNIDTRMIAGIMNFGRRKNLSLFESLEIIASENNEKQQELFVKDEEKKKIKDLVAMVHRHLKKVPTDSAGQILYYYIEDTGLLKKFLTAKTEKEITQYQNIAKLFQKLKTFEAEHEDARIFSVVEWIDLSMQMGESPMSSDTDWAENNAVNILTIHSSKGLEFPVVFLVNLVSQRFPTRERSEQIPIPADLIKEILPVGDYHLQEERRLFYVGMTRAKERLFFTAAKYYGEGKRDKKLSPFIAESLGQNMLDHLLQKSSAEKAAVQPSLLDWTNQFSDSPDAPHKATIPPITYVSYSQLQTFTICPLHYKLQYILRIPGKPTAPLTFGTSLHAALRDFYQAWMKDKSLPITEIDTFLEKVWINEGYTSKAHEKQAFEQAKYLLHQYLQKHLIHDDSQKPIAIEVPFSFFIADQNIRSAGVKIGGRIDRVDMRPDGTIEIVDYKTGKNMPSEKDLLTNLQLTLYALAATQVRDTVFNKQANQITLSLHYLEEDKILTTTRTKKQLEEAKIEILQKINEIEKSNFLCSGNMLCRNCEYKMLCSTGS